MGGEAPKGPQALTEEQLTAETQAERAEALTLDDKDTPEEANANHSEVVKYLERAENKLEDIRKQHNIGEISELQTRLDSQNDRLTTLTNIFTQNFSNLNNDTLFQDKDTLRGLVQAYPSIRSVLEGSQPKIQAINAAFSSEETRITAEIDQIQAELTPATQTKNASNNVLNALSELAVDTIKEKQEARFEDAKIDYASDKIATLFENKKDPAYQQKCTLAGEFLSGLMSNAEFTHDSDKYEEAFDACLAKTNDEAIKQYVDNLISGGETPESPVKKEEEAIFGEDEASDIRPEVRAYVHGLIASLRTVNTDGHASPPDNLTDWNQWINGRLNGINPMTVENVQLALADFHQEDNVRKLENFVNNSQTDLLAQVKNNPTVQRIYQQRMAEAMREISDDGKRTEYRTYFLAQVNRLGVENINAIRSIASPDLWNYGADSLSALPEGARAANNAPRAAVQMAERLAARCQQSGAKEGQVFAFTQDGQIYYARYSGGRDAQLYRVPDGADLSSEMSKVGEERSGGRSIQTPNATVESTHMSEERSEKEKQASKKAISAVRTTLASYINKGHEKLKEEGLNDWVPLSTEVLSAINNKLNELKVDDSVNTVVSTGGFKIKLKNGKAILTNPQYGNEWAKTVLNNLEENSDQS